MLHKPQNARPSTPVASMWGWPRQAMRRGRNPAVVRLNPSQAFNRGGCWDGCTPGFPGMMGTVNMGGVMNKPLSEILQQLERDFGQPRRPDQNSNGPSSRRSGAMRLSIDTIETDEAVWYFTDLPGLEKPDLQIKANQQERSITISGERSPPTVGEEDGKQARNLQRLFGKFSHTISLPQDADPQLISAKVDKGVLRIKVLKQSQPEPEMQNVPIDID
ncbi:hypothetical protein WJX73_000463 [Symbiochloris irregularis]|uniref:SHSP domain-containing protein n=1 Tax=Symbiochloris irregularis TaxID=706552 RepID=A0AAW1NRV1_9CHLO